MRELNELRNGLMNSTLMLLKDFDDFLECSFVKEGLVNQIVVVEDDILAEALLQRVKTGIVEGIYFNTFRHEFDNFALHVKAKMLYAELAYSLPMYLTSEPKEETAFRRSVNTAAVA